MKLNRREFLGISVATGAAGVLAPTAQAFTLPDPPQKARLRLSCQEGVSAGGSLTEKLDFLEANGFEGLEVGGRDLGKRVEELQKALQGRKIKLSAVCAGFDGVLISEQEEVRQKALSSMKEILTAAGALGSVGMIMVPAFHNQTKLGHQEARELLVKLLAELGEHAHKAGTRVLLEPLNRRECHFLRQVADGAAICRDVNHPGVALMGDFWHMTWEETSDLAAFIAAGKYLQHVHIASRKTRKVPFEDEGDNYIDGFKGLKIIGYQGFVSFECGCKGDRAKALAAAAKLLREQWEQARG
ncbi:MAG TPA: sugar phosphate isomerase/epimerase family protein [Verrucomicrobiota bacterium]|jgi:sugar phosphate isomerase/epimerase|nr:sugar phosphate isomerase/epimerase [Verrucomicrobiota bacterium]HRR65475.1 sugar phosphate isomerase/epimerase family protein [Candidatus Paceibacterota bacterium]HNR71675.1 sugar phosphate isomerase/epimerase family protein [Verrucomicrobiota bacterium]HNS70326.1 sugar phosphate isomerase/epimerase family protein [Verrucomicrobiota bacterium]HNZ75087.1 sugar phosphate isomerase/epimerase family protein [Verrucomicrobiota bacterium]